ncbi:MAG: LacI family DNA-binding transcriptional regulator [Limnochordales bacterium]|nr:LacI family DNA-binding transcriptional regulator [Limnochordales bacterium]
MKKRFSTPQQSRPPTIRDIARLAGVSPTTVSVVMNGHGRELRISAETAERVLKAAQMLNYQPDHSARSLRSGATRLIGVAVSWLADPFYPELSAAIGRALRARGYTLFLTDLPDWVESGADLGLGKSSVDGVVLVDTRRSPWHPGGKVIDPADSLVPTVMVLGEECLYEWQLPLSEHVLILATEEAGRLAARHLWERGYRRFVFVPAGFPAPMTPGHRQFGFCDELRNLGVDPEAILVAPVIRPPEAEGIVPATATGAVVDHGRIGRVADGELTGMVADVGQEQTGASVLYRPSYLSTRAVLESDWWQWARQERVGFYAANDVAAMEVLQALHEQGIAVPAEAGVVGTNGTQLGALVFPPLTSISLDVEAIAQAAVDRLLSFIEHEDTAEPEHEDSAPAKPTPKSTPMPMPTPKPVPTPTSGRPAEPLACAEHARAGAAAPVAIAGAAAVAEPCLLPTVQPGVEGEGEGRKARRDVRKVTPRLLVRGST